jgi:hypothetical protein
VRNGEESCKAQWARWEGGYGSGGFTVVKILSQILSKDMIVMSESGAEEEQVVHRDLWRL